MQTIANICEFTRDYVLTCIFLICCECDGYLPGNVASRSEFIKPNFNSFFDQSKELNNSLLPQNVTDLELKELSEILFKLDFNNCGKYISVNYQAKLNKPSSEDLSPQHLLTVQDNVWSIPTISSMITMYDNYEHDTRRQEIVTSEEKHEESIFLDRILATPVMNNFMGFLKKKGYVTANYIKQKEFLSNLWFNLYPRKKGKLTSCGFEHVFLSELKKRKIIGFHNWVYFHTQENTNTTNYLGYSKIIHLLNNISVVKLSFKMNGIQKPVSSMFIGTSPELDMALYTLCFLARPNKLCKVSLASKNFNIMTYTFEYDGKTMIGAAYPNV